MMAYNKPEFFVTEFQANAAVSACPTVNVSAITTVQNISCIATGKIEDVFNSSITGCKLQYNDNANTTFADYGIVNDFTWTDTSTNPSTTTEKDYFVWYDTDQVYTPNTGYTDPKENSLFQALMAAFFTQNNSNWSTFDDKLKGGYHVGVATETILSNKNFS